MPMVDNPRPLKKARLVPLISDLSTTGYPISSVGQSSDALSNYIQNFFAESSHKNAIHRSIIIESFDRRFSGRTESHIL
jgi:hypothetical protein